MTKKDTFHQRNVKKLLMNLDILISIISSDGNIKEGNIL